MNPFSFLSTHVALKKTKEIAFTLFTLDKFYTYSMFSNVIFRNI